MSYSNRWFLATPFLLLFLWAAIFNFAVVSLLCRNAITGNIKRVPSFGPFIGGVAGVVGLYVCPLEGLSWQRWLPLVLDVGALPYFIAMLPAILGFWRGEEPDKN